MKLQTLTGKTAEVQYEKMENEKNEAKAEELEQNCVECQETEKKSRVAALKDLVVDVLEKKYTRCSVHLKKANQRSKKCCSASRKTRSEKPCTSKEIVEEVKN